MLQAWSVVTVFLLIRAVGPWALPPSVRHRPAAAALVAPQSVNINGAALSVLQSLPGIGPRRARAIVLHRVRHGRLRTIDDLGAVDGFGAATVAALVPFIHFGAPGGPGLRDSGPGFAPLPSLR